MTRSYAHSRITIPLVRVGGSYVTGYDTLRGRAARRAIRILFGVYLATWFASTVSWVMASAGPRPMVISNASLALISIVLIHVACRIDFEPPFRVEPPGVWPLIFFTYCMAIAVAVASAWCADEIRHVLYIAVATAFAWYVRGIRLTW